MEAWGATNTPTRIKQIFKFVIEIKREMKKMSCKQLGGACDVIFTADSFDEMAAMSKAHASEMLASEDQPHLMAMRKMQDLIKSPDKFQHWFDQKQQEFENLPDIDY